MGPLEQANNQELLSHLAGPVAAAALVNHYGGLTSLAQASLDELCGVKGIGRSRAAAIKAAFLLAQRLSREAYPESPVMDTPDRVADLLREQNRVYTVENLQAVLLNARKRLIGVETICQGTLDCILVPARELFQRAIVRRAASLILVHNHPSGDPSPSDADIKVTRDLVRAGQLLRIEVLDHVILGRRTEERPRDYVSLREQGLLA